jgi:hypothetical protein
LPDEPGGLQPHIAGFLRQRAKQDIEMAIELTIESGAIAETAPTSARARAAQC